jgi:hypothetical protein
LGVGEEGCEVLEDDPGFGKVGNVEDEVGEWVHGWSPKGSG